MIKVFGRYKIGPFFAVLIVFGLAGLAIAWRFAPWMPSVFYGDDLDYLLSFEDGRCATTAAEILTATCYERFRPVTSGVVMTLMAIADHDIKVHHLFNMMLHALIATMVFVISHRLSGGRWLVSLALALAVATSRFATYQVTQMLGPLEGLTLLSILIALYAALRADARVSDSWRWGWIAIAASLGAIHAHERSVVLAVWLTIVFAVSPAIRELPRSKWLALLFASVAVPLLNVTYKMYVLHTPFLVGTGGTHLELKVPLLLEHARQAAKSLLAFNDGPEYLVGRTIDYSVVWPWLSAIAFACAWIMAILIAFLSVFTHKSNSHAPWQHLRWPLLMLMLAAFLLAPALVTIRLEQRWLLAPFTVGLLVIAWAAGTPTARQRSRQAIAALAIVLSLAAVAVDTFVMRSYDRIHFIYSPRFAETVKRDVIGKNTDQSSDIAFLTSPDHCDWTLLRGGFFRIYGTGSRKVHCFVTLEDARSAVLPAGTRIYRYDETRLVDVTAQQPAASQVARRTARIDLLDDFSKGQINNPAYVETPNGRGALLIAADAKDASRQTLTVLSGFVYRFDDIVPEPDDVLNFGISMFYSAPQSARAVVQIQVSGHAAEILYSKDLAPPAAGTKPVFLEVSLPLGKYAGQPVAISFAAQSPGGDSSAHWVSFAEPSIGARQ